MIGGANGSDCGNNNAKEVTLTLTPFFCVSMTATLRRCFGNPYIALTVRTYFCGQSVCEISTMAIQPVDSVFFYYVTPSHSNGALIRFTSLVLWFLWLGGLDRWWGGAGIVFNNFQKVFLAHNFCIYNSNFEGDRDLELKIIVNDFNY